MAREYSRGCNTDNWRYYRVLKNLDSSSLSKNMGFGVYSMNIKGGWLKLSVPRINAARLVSRC
jgi:hypothetical protein